MARMMPAYCPETAPPGEQELYARLAADQETEDWIVLHSLAIADHTRQVEGEADLVVLVPKKGILVLEVKSHRSLEVLDDGRWKLGADAPTTRSPFQQAREAFFSLREYLRLHNVDVHSVPMLYAAWFTHLRARTMVPESPEWHDWQVLDSEDLRRGVSDAIGRTFTKGILHLETKKRGPKGPFTLDEEQAGRIAAVLRPRFEMYVVPGDLRRARKTQLLTFIEEQYDALDAMAGNQEVLFTGPAGSGKTLLAMEAARRETSQGRVGRLLCFNRLLGRRLHEDLRDVSGLTVGTLHQEMLRTAGVEAPANPDQEFWEEELPDRAIDALLQEGGRHLREFLVVDEVQDIVRKPYLDFLDLLVEGGLKEGRVLLFGDFELQAIFETGDGRSLLTERCPRVVFNSLRVNCRNLPRIGHVVNTFSHLEPGYTRFRRPDDGVDPNFVSYEAGRDQSELIVESVSRLREEGFALNEIALLSPLRSGSTAETTDNDWLRQILRPIDGAPFRPGALHYSTIHAFKGLEAPAVIVSDVERNRVPAVESLLYVGLTRATDRLTAIVENRTLRALLAGAA